MNLRPTHHGYAYQDTMCGIAFVDLMLGTATTIQVDLNVDADDRFDDLTIEYAAGRRRRLQIRHTTVDRELSRATFSGDGRSLRLDLLLRSLLDDLASDPDTDYRVLARDREPDSERRSSAREAAGRPHAFYNQHFVTLLRHVTCWTRAGRGLYLARSARSRRIASACTWTFTQCQRPARRPHGAREQVGRNGLAVHAGDNQTLDSRRRR